MRNTIYASGCRYVISEARSPEAFSESRAQSWKYLENALSVHTELLYGPTSLDCIQALLLMVSQSDRSFLRVHRHMQMTLSTNYICVPFLSLECRESCFNIYAHKR
jgi:hypothetical protein